ncbi:MAG TPA: NADH:flavin oxidoreductase/NADH oxidase [Stellaceae bacterium]|nr:NADH:flavin oxidoreductase/NADH oxidase [Stellaceae bacterium]
MSSQLFTPISLRGLTLANRIVVSPMCQYSADDGSATDWHMQHLGMLSHSGAGLLVIEATGIEREGRITPGCLGLYSDANEAALARVLAACRRYSRMPIGIQLAHAGRKASAAPPWEGAGPLPPERHAWTTVAPSPLPFDAGWPTPKPLAEAEIDRIVESFQTAARRAARLGLDEVELHCAHGYLMHEFLSPIANRREDRYGGSLENRMRFPLRVAEAVRAVWPADKPMGARLSATDWRDDGWTIEDSVVFARALKERGCDFVCASSGGIAGRIAAPQAPGYMVRFADRIRREAGIVSRAVGLIVTAAQADTVIAEGLADMVALARAVLDDPRWGWHAAEALGASVAFPPQYDRVNPKTWPGAKMARPAPAA